MSTVKEFLISMDGLDDRSAAWLQRQGVPRTAIDMWPGPVGVTSIETHPMGCFEFAESKRRAFIQPVLSGGEFTDACNLVAWYPDDPSHWWTRFYSEVPLGVDQLDRAEILVEPLAICRTPLSWLQAGGRGIVVTDWAMTALALGSVPTLIAEDDRHAAEIHERLSASPQRVPDLRVFDGHVAA